MATKTGKTRAAQARAPRAAAKDLKDAATHAGSGVAALAANAGELVAQASQNTLAINPLVGLTRRDVAGAAGSLLKALSKAPRKTAKKAAKTAA